MNNFDKIKGMNEEELVEWLDAYFAEHEDTPWDKWFGDKYCENCESVISDKYSWGECECSYCEVNNRCRYFAESDGYPEAKTVIKMWLEDQG